MKLSIEALAARGRKISASRMGHKVSQVTRDKIRATLTGSKAGKQSKERREGQRTAQLKLAEKSTFGPRYLQRHYVYCWALGDQVVYLGKGRGTRAWRNFAPEFRALLLLPSFSVKILVVLEDEAAAAAIEKQLIENRKPIWNKTYARKVSWNKGLRLKG